MRGCSSVVEHLLAKERVESSNLFIRFLYNFNVAKRLIEVGSFLGRCLSLQHQLLAVDRLEAQLLIEAGSV